MTLLIRTIVILGALLSQASLAAVEVGTVAYSRGVLTGQVDGESPRLIGKGVALHNGETLNTGSRGFALITLDDGSKMTLRPNTTIKIEDLNIDKGSENALLSLIRGGLRAVTGFISKARPNAFRINTSVATIGIRGTEFDARLCEASECQQEEAASGKTARRESRVVGRIALLRGKASATVDGGESRVLTSGAAIYERDQIQTGIKSYAVIAFNDETRATLAPQTVIRVEEHEFKPEQPDENNSFLSFLQGGLRMVTGAIGRLNKKAFRVATPTATIGIRGTGFDLVCEGTCVSSNAALDPAADSLLGKFLQLFIKPAYALGDGNGMYAKVWSGAIELQLAGNMMVLNNGGTAYLKDNFSRPILVPDIPAQLRAMGGAPRPDKVPMPVDAFSEAAPGIISPGLYVNVRKGDVAVLGADGKVVNIGAGEALRASIGAVVRLGFVPAFQKYDKFPDPARITLRAEKMLNLFGAEGVDKESMECTVQ
ncbi:MAG TPA: FecR family protein [Gammaproteobacteria bacterium]|nr:FecR family protein [Gammaproteobacteria bacterium]